MTYDNQLLFDIASLVVRCKSKYISVYHLVRKGYPYFARTIFTRECFDIYGEVPYLLHCFSKMSVLYLWRLSSELSIYSVSFHLLLPMYPVAVPGEKSLFIHSIKGTSVELSILLARTSITDFYFRMSKTTFHPYYNFQIQSFLVSNTMYMR